MGAAASTISGDITGASNWRNNLPGNTDPETFVWRSNQFIHIPPIQRIGYSCDGYGINAGGPICGITFLYSPNPRWWAYVWYDTNQWVDFTDE